MVSQNVKFEQIHNILGVIGMGYWHEIGGSLMICFT